MPINRWFKTEIAARKSVEIFLQRAHDSLSNGAFMATVGMEGAALTRQQVDILFIGQVLIKKSFVETEGSTERVYVPYLTCPIHRTISTFSITHLFNISYSSYPSYICPYCYKSCPNCGRNFPREYQSGICPCCRIDERLQYCTRHEYTFREYCHRCFEERESWSSIKVDDGKIKAIQEITKQVIFRKKNKLPKEILYRPMCRRNRDFRVLDIIEKVGMLPVQICIIGGTEDFMEGKDIMVGTDVRLPTHPLTKIVGVSPYMAKNLPYTVALSKEVRKSDVKVAKIISWMKEFK